MRSLTLSLLVVVVIAIFGLGWAFDALFAKYSDSPRDDVVTFTQLVGRDTSLALNQMANPEEFVGNWGGEYSVQAGLTHLDDFALPEALKNQIIAGEPLMLESDQGLSVNYFLPAHQLIFSIDHIPPNKPSYVKVLFTSAFYLGTLALVLLWLKPLLQRLRLLGAAATDYGSGDLNRRVESKGISYIADIEKQFNRMADQIQALVEDNKLLTSAVSHDLRTPLARLRFGIDTLQVTDSPTARTEYGARISRDLDEMESLVNSLLRYARMDNVMSEVEKKDTSLVELSRECVSQFLDEVITVSLIDEQANAGHNDIINCSIEHVATMINNLLQNAMAHASSQVIVEVSRSGGLLMLSVCDDGDGVAAETRGRMLKPFQRGDGSTGYGLGLAVVSRIASHHQAELTIGQCERLGGAEFAVGFLVD